MKKIKKLLCLVFALALVLTGCAEQAANDDPVNNASDEVQNKDVKLKVMVVYDVQTFGAYMVDQWQTISDKLGYELEFENPGADTYKTKIKVALAGGELPDIFSIWGGKYLEPFIDAGAVLPVQDYIANSGITYRDLYLTPSADNNLYVIPTQEEAYAVTFCNNDLLNKVGSKVPTNWDELVDLVEATKAYNEANGTNLSAIGVGVKDRWVAEVLYTMVVNRLDKDAFDKMMNHEIDMTDEVFVEAARKIQQLADMGAFPDGFMQTAASEANEVFLSDQYILYPHQSSLMNKYAAAMPDNLGVIQFPDLANPADPDYAKNLMNGNGKTMPGVCISSKTQFPDEAAELALDFSEAVNTINVTQFGNPGTIKDESLQIPEDLAPSLKDYSEMVNNATHMTSYWYASVDANIGEPWRDLVQKLYAGAVTPEDFAKEANTVFADR
ncbi:MAG: ABC transporter substrate-binding protein [Acetanaerobacterium sp.]